MARDPKYGITLNGWERLGVSMEINAQDLPHLEAKRTQLAAMLIQVRELAAQQATLTASKQEVTKRLQTLLAEGRKLANFLRAGVRQHYGNRAEKLVEFDLQPFRGRPRTQSLAPPEGKGGKTPAKPPDTTE
ncbi:MAG TPA: hypothetical protein VF756_26770 [Thermoanaerobaculia bacterium]